MTCEECQDNTTFYLTHQLTTAEEEEFRRHLNQCDACQKELELNERLSRAVHNVSVPFRQAADRIEANVLSTSEEEASVSHAQRSMRLVRKRFGVYAFAGVGALLALVFVSVLLFRGNDARVDQLANWAVQHYSLIDQTHPLRGDAETVRAWFRDHHQVEVVPPRNVDYGELIGCKMIEMDSDPAPLLRFAGPEPCAVFMLPTRVKTQLEEGSDFGLERDGYRIRLWVEGNHPYLKISKLRGV